MSELVKNIIQVFDVITDIYIIVFIIRNYKELSKMSIFTKKGN